MLRELIPAAILVFAAGCNGLEPEPPSTPPPPDMTEVLYEKAFAVTLQVLQERFDVEKADPASGILKASYPKNRFRNDPIQYVTACVKRKSDGSVDVEIWSRHQSAQKDILHYKEPSTGSGRFNLPGEDPVLEKQVRDIILDRIDRQLIEEERKRKEAEEYGEQEE